MDKEIVESTFNQYKTNVFFMYLVKTFGVDVAYQLRDDYNIGTAKGGGTIFGNRITGIDSGQAR